MLWRGDVVVVALQALWDEAGGDRAALASKIDTLLPGVQSLARRKLAKNLDEHVLSRRAR